jgi:hypothetical protein
MIDEDAHGEQTAQAERQTRNELVNFINSLRAHLQTLGVNSDGSKR